MKAQKTQKLSVLDTLSKCKLDFAKVSTYVAEGTNTHFGKFQPDYKLYTPPRIQP